MSDFKGVFKQLQQKVDGTVPSSASDQELDKRCPDCLGKITKEWMSCPHPDASVNWPKQGKVPRVLKYCEWEQATPEGVIVHSYKKILHGTMSTAGWAGRPRKDPKQPDIDQYVNKKRKIRDVYKDL